MALQTKRILPSRLLLRGRDAGAESSTLSAYNLLTAADELVEAAAEMVASNNIARLAEAIERYRTTRLAMRGVKLTVRRLPQEQQ